MPRIDRDSQEALWKVGDALARALQAPPDANSPGDPRWTVTGRATGGWKIDHPDLPLVKDSQGTAKDVLLQMHVTKQGPMSLVIAQNKVIGPGSHSSPQAVVVARETGPPTDWDVDVLADAAANFFRKQKDDLVQQARSLTPKTPPGTLSMPSQAPPGGGLGMGMGGPPLSMAASRRRRIATLVARPSFRGRRSAGEGTAERPRSEIR